jgi:AcrR family transcriptional regulator
VSDRAEPAPGRPGRPSTGARERILEAGLETLLAEGYAGMTTAKVALRAGENKALISYHFGSKQGLVAAAAAQLGDRITQDVLAGVADARTATGILEGIVAAISRLLAEDERIARLYFDLNAVSVVEDEVRGALREVKRRWRAVLAGLLREAGVPARRIDAATVLVIAGVEGLALERLERGETPELEQARRLFVSSAASGIGGR